MTTVRYEGGIPHILHDEIAEQTSTTVALTKNSTPTVLCNAASAPITVSLPLASTSEGVIFTIKKTDSSSNAVTIQRSGSDLIDGVTSHTITQQYVTMAFESDGTSWSILNLDSDFSFLQAEITARMNADSTLASLITSGNVYEVTSSAAVAAGDEVFANTTSNPITLTLPASPATGARVKVVDPRGTWGTNTCTIARNGNKIAGYNADLDLTIPNDSVEIVFYSPTSDWRMK